MLLQPQLALSSRSKLILFFLDRRLVVREKVEEGRRSATW